MCHAMCISAIYLLLQHSDVLLSMLLLGKKPETDSMTIGINICNDLSQDPGTSQYYWATGNSIAFFSMHGL